MEYANRAGSQGTVEPSRAVSQTMVELASAVGDLETALRALAGRIGPLIPGGAVVEDAGRTIQTAVNTPKAVRSPHCEELQTRVYQLGAITGSIQRMVENIEI